MGPAYRIESPRLVLRCWEPRDAELLSTAVAESLDHLRAWMPWAAQEPLAVEQRVEYLRRFRAAFDRDEDYVYGVFDADEAVVVGGAGLHTRLGPRALEIGYWIHVDHVGRGYATEVAAALTRTGFATCDIDRIEIHHDPNNVASGRVPEKLGYHRDATLRQRARTPEGAWRDTVVWSMMQDELEGSPAAELNVSMFDCRGLPSTP